MWRPSTFFSLVARSIFVATAFPAHSAIFVTDDRQYASTARGTVYSPVGIVWRVAFTYETHATGTLIDDCHVLTARHIYARDESVVGKRLSFSGAVGTPNEMKSWGTIIAAGRAWPKAVTLREELEHIADDWLLLRLDNCLGRVLGHAGVFDGRAEINLNGTVQNAGYPIDRNRWRGLTIDPSCRILRKDIDGALMNDCAVRPGNSGGPIFRVTGSGDRQRMEILGIENLGYEPKEPVSETDDLLNAATPTGSFLPYIKRFLNVREEAGAQ